MQNAHPPVDLLHWGLALVPVLALLIFLAMLHWRAAEAGPIGMFAAAAAAIWAYRTPFDTLAVAGAKGVWDAIFILYVIWPALLLYHVLDSAGTFDAVQQGIQRFSRDRLFIVLALGWVFVSFLQGVAGFGTPIAVAAPLLVAVGVRPLYAVAVPLIGHAWATMFGTLGVGWLATLQVIDLESQSRTAFETALLLWPATLLAGLSIAWFYGRMAAVRHALPMVLVLSAIHGGGELLLTLWDPVLAAFIASSAALVALYPLSRWKRYSGETQDIQESRIMDGSDGGKEGESAEAKTEPVMSLRLALVPYLVLALVSVTALAIPQLETMLQRWELGFRFPSVGTGYGLTIESQAPYSPFAPLTHPGTFLLITVLVAWAIYRVKGCYRAWKDRSDTGPLIPALIDDALPASVAVVTFLVMSKVMDHSGQTEVLARGIAGTAPPLVYAFTSNWIGILGAFMTSSNTASNILFAPLQQEAVQAIPGLQESSIIAAQSAGGAIGNAVAPANIVLGTGTAGISGREGEVLRTTLPWTALAAVVTGAATILLTRF